MDEKITTELRSLRHQESRLIGDIIGDSFSDDPVNLWIFGGRESMRRFYAMAARKLYLRQGFGHVSGDGCAGSLWLPPGVEKHIPLWNSLDIAVSMIKYGGLQSIKRGMAVDETLVKAKPKEPHYYLFAIGARQNQQGKGLGGKLMKAGLARADGENMPSYLESSKESNVGFYQQFGFRVIDVVQPKGECPPLWLMWRDAQ